MTPQYSALETKMKLIAVFTFTLCLVGLFFAMKLQSAPGKAQAAGPEQYMFMGVRHVPPAEIHQLIPQSQGKPTLIEFHSRLCHDCRRMAPVLEKLVTACTGVNFRKYDILEDKQAHPDVFRSFKPVSVPILVFVDSQGTTREVLYNYQEPSAVTRGLGLISPQVKSGACQPGGASKAR